MTLHETEPFDLYGILEQHFAKALPGAKCVKVTMCFELAEGDMARVGVLRENCDDPDDETE